MWWVKDPTSSFPLLPTGQMALESGFISPFVWTNRMLWRWCCAVPGLTLKGTGNSSPLKPSCHGMMTPCGERRWNMGSFGCSNPPPRVISVYTTHGGRTTCWAQSNFRIMRRWVLSILPQLPEWTFKPLSFGMVCYTEVDNFKYKSDGREMAHSDWTVKDGLSEEIIFEPSPEWQERDSHVKN